MRGHPARLRWPHSPRAAIVHNRIGADRGAGVPGSGRCVIRAGRDVRRFRGSICQWLGLASELWGRAVEHGPHQLSLLGVKNGFDPDHAVLGVPAADIPALQIAQRVRVLAMAQDERVLAAGLLELRAGHQPGVLEQQVLVRGRGHADHGADLRVRDLAPPQRIVDLRKLGKLASHADMIARRAQAPADAPRQPVRA